MNRSVKEIIVVPTERIAGQIFWIRGKKVMLDRDLAELYGVQTKALKQAVRRNKERFPEDFMFELSKAEFENWRSQFVTSKADKKGLRYTPMAFTEQGVAMLSSVLHSKRAILVNIQIIRTFVKLRELLATNESLRKKIETMERKYDQKFKAVFDVIKSLLAEEEKPETRIGFHHK
ncbi:MAG: ORF6N domain-containing protein [Candidatus Niyogibacteria bacterium]|nr:ORF6N domain-containing protein [Candidatus Niyogibacteria bacterium]